MIARVVAAALAIGALAASGCSSPPPLPEVRVYASVSPLAAQALATLALNRRVARVVPVDTPAEADLCWFGDPIEALRDPALLAPASAPESPGVAARWKDPAGRFFPLGARARVLLVSPRAALPIAPRHLRDLADPRLGGLQAMGPVDRGAGPATWAALALLSSEKASLELASAILRQGAQVAPDDAGVQALVASGKAAFGLAGSEQGAAGAASAAALEVVYPDQGGFGTLVFPTAAAITQRGLPSPHVHSLAGWMSGADAEQLLVARVPGLLPLRQGVPLPVGVRQVSDLRAPQMDWNRLAEVDRSLTPQLGRIVKH